MSHEPQEREQRRAELREVLNTPTPKEQAAAELQRLDAEEAQEREATGRQAAQERMVGISRAVGGLVSALEAAEARLGQAAEAYADAARQVHECSHKLVLFRAEALALVDRFAVAAPPLVEVAPPAHQPAVVAALAVVAAVGFAGHGGGIVAAVEQDDTRLRERRSYRELPADCPAAQIIAAAGLKPWPPLTERQQEILQERTAQREHEQRAAERFRSQAAAEVATGAVRDFGGPRARR